MKALLNRPARRYLWLLPALALAIAYVAFSDATGLSDGINAWFLAHPSVHIVLRVFIALIFVGAGAAWLFDPDRREDGRVKLSSRILMVAAFAIAALQLSVLFFPELIS